MSPLPTAATVGTRAPAGAVGFALPGNKRLDKRGVAALLKRGARVGRAAFDIRSLGRPAEVAPGLGARLAVAVPKRQLKKAVARNRIKRLIRELFRQHTITAAPLDLLVTLKSAPKEKSAAVRHGLRRELSTLFDEALRRAAAGPRATVTTVPASTPTQPPAA